MATVAVDARVRLPQMCPTALEENATFLVTSMLAGRRYTKQKCASETSLTFKVYHICFIFPVVQDIQY